MSTKFHVNFIFTLLIVLFLSFCSGDKDKSSSTTETDGKTSLNNNSKSSSNKGKEEMNPNFSKAKDVISNFFLLIKEKKFSAAVQLIDPKKLENELQNILNETQLPSVTDDSKKIAERYMAAIINQQFNGDFQVLTDYSVADITSINNNNVSARVTLNLKDTDGNNSSQELQIDVIKARNGQWYIGGSIFD